MPAQMIAMCDGPGCTTTAPATNTYPAPWPDSFIVIELLQARDALPRPKEYGFCSRPCFIRWATP